jgi:hypothetical protein
MAKFNDYPENTLPADVDLLLVTDVSDTTDNVAGSTKNLPLSILKDYIAAVLQPLDAILTATKASFTVAHEVKLDAITGGNYVGTIPPSNAEYGSTWLMEPDDHIAMRTRSGWKPLYPPTDNKAVATATAFENMSGLWVASEGS